MVVKYRGGEVKMEYMCRGWMTDSLKIE